MATKRLFWFFDLHGGAVGIINLGAGSARVDEFLAPLAFILQLDPVTSAGTATFDFGTIAEPTLLTDTWSPGDLVTGEPRTIRYPNWEVPQPTIDSPWAMRINAAPLTGGVIEVYFQTVRST